MSLSVEYIAGFFDGEGNIYRTSTQRRVTIVQVDPSPLEQIKEQFGGKLVYRVRQDPRHKPLYSLEWYDKAGISRFLSTIRPFLIVKAAQADAMLEAIATSPGRHRRSFVCPKGHKRHPDDAGKWCRDCRREYNREYYRAKRRQPPTADTVA